MYRRPAYTARAYHALVAKRLAGSFP
jgi:hypothetical protein